MNVICVDDEEPALDNFRLTVEDIPEIKSLQLFRNGKETIRWVRENPADLAFLDMDMPEMHGLELAKQLKEINRDIRIVFCDCL